MENSIKIRMEQKYAEAFSHGYQMTMLDKSMQQIFSPIRCKDYIGDLFWAEYNKMPINVWAFVWKPGKYDISQKYHKLFIFRDHSKHEFNNIEQSILFMNKFADELGFERLTIENAKADIEDQESKDGRIFTFSSDYTVNKLHLSALLEAIRLSIQIQDNLDIVNLTATEVLNKINREALYQADSGVLNNFIKGYSFLISNKGSKEIKEMDFINRKGDNNYCVHNLGICTFASNNIKK